MVKKGIWLIKIGNKCLAINKEHYPTRTGSCAIRKTEGRKRITVIIKYWKGGDTIFYING